MQIDPEYLAIIRELYGASPRAAAIVAGARVEDALATAISTRLIQLTSGDHAKIFKGASGPLSSFHAKIQIGFGLGLYSEAVRQDLTGLKAIRNAFAHEMSIRTFDNPNIGPLCGRLNLPYSMWGISRGLAPPVNIGIPWSMFEVTTSELSLRLARFGNRFFSPFPPSLPAKLDYPMRPGVRATSPKKDRVRPSRNRASGSDQKSIDKDTPPRSSQE